MKTEYTQDAQGCGLLCEDHTQLNSDIYGYHAMQKCQKSFILLLRVWFFWPIWATSLHFLLPLIPGSHCLSLVFEFNFILFYCACVWSCVYRYVQTCGYQKSTPQCCSSGKVLLFILWQCLSERPGILLRRLACQQRDLSLATSSVIGGQAHSTMPSFYVGSINQLSSSHLHWKYFSN